MKIKPIFITLILGFLLATKCFSSDNNSLSEVEKYCNRSAAEADIGTNLYEAGAQASITIQLLAGNAQGAIDQLGSELALKIVMLNEQLKKNPCHLNEKALARIYPILRVIAAANHLKAIPQINNDKNIMEILSQSVKNNPDHYKRLIERSADWEHGIK